MKTIANNIVYISLGVVLITWLAYSTAKDFPTPKTNSEAIENELEKL